MLIMTVIILILGWMAYVYVLQPVYLGSTELEKTIHVDGSPRRIVLVPPKDQEGIYSLEIEFGGRVDDILDISIADHTQIPVVANVKGPEIDYSFKNDWYNDTCFITVRSRSGKSGTLNIRYRFLGH